MNSILFDSDRWTWSICLLGLLVIIPIGCTDDHDPLFERLSSTRTGVDFENVSAENDSLLEALELNHIFSEGGVAIGDVNNDGRPDLYFTGGFGQRNELYLNEGDMQFRKSTEAAGLEMESAWSKGVALVDVNQDGLLDLYVCVGGPKDVQPSRANHLYINQGIDDEGIPSFEERAEEYGLADTSYSIHAAFFDYDQDGNLDLYLLNSSTGDRGQVTISEKKTQGGARDTDRLYRNNGNGMFTDVSQETGIQIEGHGLGLVISDVNKDGWPDVYVANDFVSNDLLYINNGDGTFSNRIGEQLKYQPYSAMGVDIADINNDSWNDIVVLDMLPPSRVRNHRMSRFFDQATFERSLQFGFEPQYVRNMLQLNNGPRPTGRLSFSEIGQMAGIAATDWSWAPLLADFNNDGNRDLFVSNGYGKDMTDLDFVRRREQILAFGTEESQREQIRDEVRRLPAIELPNYFFENEGDLTFTDRTNAWIDSSPGISTGAAMADLDQDGDLDLVINNMNEEASILESRASERDSANAVRIKLHGPVGNRNGLGTKMTLYHESTTQYYEHTLYRGYQSTVENIAHFGLGADSTADSLKVVWPDGRSQFLANVQANQVLDVYYDSSSQQSHKHPSSREPIRDSLLFQEVSEERGLSYQHEEYHVDDFDKTPLLPHKFSQNGPGLAVGDVDGNELDDVFVGADRAHDRHIYLQTAPGRFTEQQLQMETKHEDMGALFFDAEGDGDLDLYVVSGGNVGPAQSDIYQDRLYLNEGDGSFRRATQALPDLSAGGSTVSAADYDRDGDLDLFVGGRVIPDEYPLPPRSYLLRNDSEDGGVQFTDVTHELAPKLAEIGMVTDALWTDYDNDGRLDLLVAGEWMPLSVFKNEGDRFDERTDEAGLNDTAGWWNSLTAGDFDRDGDMDYVAGNLGLNTRYEASPSEPVRVHAKDFDGNGEIDPVLTHYVNSTNYPVARRDELIEQIPGIKTRFPSYREYAEATFEEIFTDGEMEGAYEAEAVRFETSYLENKGDGTFEVRSLPLRTQTAPIFGMQAGDYNEDGFLDLLMVGNWYAPTLRTGRAGAFIGALLQGDGTGHFSVATGTKSGFFVDGDAKALAEVTTGGDSSLVLATQNNGPLKVFRNSSNSRLIELQPSDRHAILTFEDGSTQKHEFFHGSTYLSQSSRFLEIAPQVTDVEIYNSEGGRRGISIDDPLPAARE